MSYVKTNQYPGLGHQENQGQVKIKLDRAQVIQETCVFNDLRIQPRRCRMILAKLALLRLTGEKFSAEEASNLYFSIQKLFGYPNVSLRQMSYLVEKELSDSVPVTETFMMTNTASKDITGETFKELPAEGEEWKPYKSIAIRALCRILNVSNRETMHLFQNAILSNSSALRSAGLVSAYHMLPFAKDTIRDWIAEIQNAASESLEVARLEKAMCQYHVIGLLYQLRMHDRIALVKMVQQLGATGSSGATTELSGIVLLVRLAGKLAEEDASLRKPMMQLLEGWLRHKELVAFEAAKVICDVRDATDDEIALVIHVLQMFLTSPRAITKFTTLRILHNLATFKPLAVGVCNPELEHLMSDTNRSIANFAITLLPKTVNEASVDRLLKLFSELMSEATDELKITIIEAFRTLCLRFPGKQASILTFLSGLLRDEGGYELKRAVVEGMFDLIKFIPDSKEEALAHLCEFIEDCEFTKLAVRILYVVGLKGPETAHPTKYIRYIYNRVVLENAIVRAAAVAALAKFGVGQKDPDVKASVKVLLTRCLDDVDDEVRDRAALNLKLMGEEDDTAVNFIRNENVYSLPILEHQLIMYVTSEDQASFNNPFDISKIPVITREQADAEDKEKKLEAITPIQKVPKVGAAKPPASGIEAVASAQAQAQRYSEELMQFSEMREFGNVLKSSPRIELTEAETEYVVTLVKHVFKEHIVFQYEIKNTLPDTVLEAVSVVATPNDEDELEEVFILQCEKLVTNEPGNVYVAFKKANGEGSMPIASFSNMLKFTSKEIDPSTGEPEASGYDDEYEMSEFELSGSDYIVPTFASNFSHLWEQIGASGEEAEETLQLGSVKSIADATEQLAQALSLQPLEGTDVPVNPNTHTLKLLGKTVNGGRVVANVRMAFSSKSGVTTKITVRSEEENVAALVIASLA